MWPLSSGPLGAGGTAAGACPAVGRHCRTEPCSAGQAQRDGRAVWLLDGLLPVQPGGNAVALTAGAAGASGTAGVMRVRE